MCEQEEKKEQRGKNGDNYKPDLLKIDAENWTKIGRPSPRNLLNKNC